MNGQNAFQALLAQNKQVLDQRSASGRSGGQRRVNAFTQAKFPQAPRPNPPAERNPLERTRGDRWRNALGTLLGGDPNIGRQAQQDRDLQRFSEAFAADPGQAIQYAQQAGRGDLVQYGQGLLEQQKKAASAQVSADRQNATYELLQASNPLMAAAYLANPEKFGESLATNYEAATLDPGQTHLRDAGGLSNYSTTPEGVVVGANEILANRQTGATLAQGPEAQPDLPTGMVMGPNGPEYIPDYLEGQERLRQAGRSTTTINTGDVANGQRPIVGKPEPGTQLFYDEQEDTYRSQPIPGSDDDFTREQDSIALDLKYQSANIRHEGIIGALDTALGQTGPGTAGVAGVTRIIPGMPAHDLAATLNRIKAVIGFDRLQQMREESKTGGALGNVSEKEIDFLQSVQGSLSQTQSVPQLLATLQNIRGNLQAIHGFREQAYQLESSKFAEKINTQTGQLEAPPDVEPSNWQTAVNILRQNPNTAAAFDQTYGEGMAARVLGGQ